MAGKFGRDLGIKVTVETPQGNTTSFPIAAQAGGGPDIVIWAHDKAGEWEDGGLIAPLEVPPSFVKRFFPTAWDAVRHQGLHWGYPPAHETVTLIYNKLLLDGAYPADLDQLAAVNEVLQARHPGVRTIVRDYDSAYYSWGLVAGARGYVFGRTGRDYDLHGVGVATPGAAQPAAA